MERDGFTRATCGSECFQRDGVAVQRAPVAVGLLRGLPRQACCLACGSARRGGGDASGGERGKRRRASCARTRRVDLVRCTPPRRREMARFSPMDETGPGGHAHPQMLERGPVVRPPPLSHPASAAVTAFFRMRVRYKLMRVRRKASPKKLREAYRRLAKRAHPDKVRRRHRRTAAARHAPSPQPRAHSPRRRATTVRPPRSPRCATHTTCSPTNRAALHSTLNSHARTSASSARARGGARRRRTRRGARSRRSWSTGDGRSARQCYCWRSGTRDRAN